MEEGADGLETRRSDRGVHVAVFPGYADFPVTRLRLELDSPGVAGWNEIDAVGLGDEPAPAPAAAAVAGRRDRRAHPG